MHFGPAVLRVDARSWHEPGGHERTAGGYRRIARSCRTMAPGPLLDLVRDFSPRTLPAFQGGTVYAPGRRVYLDTRPPWWLGEAVPATAMASPAVAARPPARNTLA